MSESTVDEMVRRGVLPRPLRLSNGCVRWSWASVEAALGSLAPTGEHKAPEDPFIAGARRAAQIARGHCPTASFTHLVVKLVCAAPCSFLSAAWVVQAVVASF